MSWGTIGVREELAAGTRRPLRLTPEQLQEAGLVCRGPRFFRARPADRTRCNWGLETAVTFCSFLRRRPSNLCPKIGLLPKTVSIWRPDSGLPFNCSHYTWA